VNSDCDCLYLYKNCLFPLQVKVEGSIEAGKRIPLVDIGAGVFPTALFFNHSCSPNTVRVNQGSKVNLKI